MHLCSKLYTFPAYLIIFAKKGRGRKKRRVELDNFSKKMENTNDNNIIFKQNFGQSHVNKTNDIKKNFFFIEHLDQSSDVKLFGLISNFNLKSLDI